MGDTSALPGVTTVMSNVMEWDCSGVSCCQGVKISLDSPSLDSPSLDFPSLEVFQVRLDQVRGSEQSGLVAGIPDHGRNHHSDPNHSRIL